MIPFKIEIFFVLFVHDKRWKFETLKSFFKIKILSKTCQNSSKFFNPFQFPKKDALHSRRVLKSNFACKFLFQCMQKFFHYIEKMKSHLINNQWRKSSDARWTSTMHKILKMIHSRRWKKEESTFIESMNRKKVFNDFWASFIRRDSGMGAIVQFISSNCFQLTILHHSMQHRVNNFIIKLLHFSFSGTAYSITRRTVCISWEAS